MCYEKSEHSLNTKRQLQKLIELIPVLPMSAVVDQHYGRIRADLAKLGKMIGNNDLWIAAHAFSEGLTLVTNNLKEFLRIKSLSVENWV